MNVDKSYAWVDRLYVKPDKNSNTKKRESTANDALISALPSETLSWMRKRRSRENKGKVAISIFQERQLREIFNGLDLENTGVINLGQLQEAALYVENTTKDSVTPLKNVYELFANMDDDGNGEVDFHEFTQAMIISKARSEIEVQRMHQKFIEFAFIKKREYSLRTIEEIKRKVELEMDDESVNSKNKKEQREFELDIVQAGVQAYRLYKNLFQGKKRTIGEDDNNDDNNNITKTKTNTLSSSHININIIEHNNRKLQKAIKYIDQLNGYNSKLSAYNEEEKNIDEEENIPKFRRKSTFRDALTEYDNTISDLTISNTDSNINTNTNTNTDITNDTNTKTDSSNSSSKETKYRELRERLLKKKKDELIEIEKDPDGRHLMKRIEEERLFDIELNKLITPKATLDTVSCKVGKLILPKETLIPAEDTIKSIMKSKMTAGKLVKELLPSPIIEKHFLKPVGNLKETNTTTINSMKVNYSAPQLQKIENFPQSAPDGKYYLANDITWKDKKIPGILKKKLAQNVSIF